jgi:Zn finger protein HypA/HybF involved in hydrogenase expression
MTRLIAECRSCGHAGPRGDFHHKRPDDVPAFRDVCPKCQSDNVDVIDKVAAAAAIKTGYAPLVDGRAAAA